MSYRSVAHFFAWADAKVLHRDISAGNIMIDPTTRGGFLIDWDLSRLECELEVGPVEPVRSVSSGLLHKDISDTHVSSAGYLDI